MRTRQGWWPLLLGRQHGGQLIGAAVTPFQTTPALVDTSAIAGSARVLGPGWRRTCLIDDARHLWCAGTAGSSALGIVGEGSHQAPTELAGNWGEVVAGENMTCAIAVGGELKCWGINESGELGDGTRYDQQVPVSVAGPQLLNAPALASSEHVCAIASDGKLYCWGDNQYDQLGVPGGSSTLPRLTEGTRSWTSIGARNHTCGITTGQELWCWGRNQSGQCGVAVSPAVGPPRAVLPRCH